MANEELPISLEQAKKVSVFLLGGFDKNFTDATIGTPFDKKHLVAIACQETAYMWVNWIGKYDSATILKRCVLDGTGDTNDTIGMRSAFPKNKVHFLTKFPQSDLDMLIEEGNKTRQLRGLNSATILYKGYGLWQYDLQYILTDKDFFLQKQWYSMAECLKRVMKELNGKYAIAKDVRTSIRMYNGSGQRAENYANNVLTFYNYIK
jgi:hypothetical protein